MNTGLRNPRAAVPGGVVLLVLTCTPAFVSARPPRIELAEFRIEPLELSLGQTFTIRARAVATRVKLGSFLLRTADPVPKDDTIAGLPLYAKSFYYMEEDGRYFLTDNGKRDLDPRQGAFALQVATEGWKPGTRRFAFFASCRPSDGPFVAARHEFSVAVEDRRVRIKDLGPVPLGASRVITRFDAEPRSVEPGEPVRITLGHRPGAVEGVQLANPYPISEAETLPGFQYDAAKKRAFYPGGPKDALQPGDEKDGDARTVFQLDTSGWPPGVVHLKLSALGHSGKSVDYRCFAIKVKDPRDRLKVSVEDTWPLAPGTHFGRFVKLGDGSLLCRDMRSTDGGRTWQGPTGGFGVGAEPLGDGSVLGLEYRCLPEKGSQGWYTVGRSVSADGGRSFEKSEARVHVPRAKAAMGHAFHPGPLFMRSIVERDDGSLVGLFAGWFQEDTALCPYGRGRPYSRTYVCSSDDAGVTWRYGVTIGYDRIGSEGYNEGSMRRLPDGRLLAVMRTGNERDLRCQDNPIMWSESRDGGRTWSPPRRTGLEGAYPSLAVLSDGQVALSYGRPGAMIAFSADAGRTWTDRTPVDATPYSGYTDVVEIGPGLLLVGFGTKDYLDPNTGQRSSQLRLARVRYRVEAKGAPTE